MHIKHWVESTTIYPPGHIYAGMSQGKPERAAINACEPLYRFSYGDDKNPLGELRASWRDFEVLMKLGEHYQIKEVYINDVCDSLLEKAQQAVNAMDSTFKKNQTVNEYYKTWRLSYQDIKSEVEKVRKLLCQD